MRKLIWLFATIGTASAGEFYVGVDAGAAWQSFIYNNSIAGQQISNSQLTVSATSPSLQLGLDAGYMFNRNWGIDLGYQYFFNSNTVTGATISSNNDNSTFNLNGQLVDLVGVGRLPIEDSNFAVYAKLGLALAYAQFGQYCTTTCASGGNLPSGTGVSIALGLGLEYMITRQWDVHVEAMNYGGLLPVTLSSNGQNVGSWSATSLLLGGAWHFN
jgi:opacity protein-like surface antigen